MATRPIFLATSSGSNLVIEWNVDFAWCSGFSAVQKKKNVAALHSAAIMAGLDRILEISTKSEFEIGRRLSAFSLKVEIDGRLVPLESAYQSSKVFRNTGPFPEVLDLPPRDAKKFVRERGDGDLIAFHLFGREFPLVPKNAFYDWLYIRSLSSHDDWIEKNVLYSAFTDIEFNPTTQVNCQARAFAEYVSLQRRSKIAEVAEDYNLFSNMINNI